MKIENDRRRNRSENTYTALRNQLDACRERSGLAGMVLTDDTGLPLAASGSTNSCDEVAARLALIGRKVGWFTGVLFSDHETWEVSMQRFSVGKVELYMCAFGGTPDPRGVEIERSIAGACRILE